MGTTILIIAIIIEATFAAYCFVTKSNQRRARSFVRIGAFAAFVVLTLVSVIQWGFRWYALAVLLLVWAALGALTLLRKKVEKAEFRAWRIVLKGMAMLLLVFIALIPALVFPQHKSPRVTGKHEVATVNYTYTDESRVETFAETGEKRKVNVEFWYPKDAQGTYPLVVFSPGSFGMRESNTSTFLELASNGYVVCAIDHPYHSLYTKDTDGHTVIVDKSFIQEGIDVNGGKYDEAAVFKIEQKWMQLRTTDIKFVLDTILAQAREPGPNAVYGLIDPEKIGLLGHSLGGASSAQVARERNDIDAVINLDADLYGEYLDYADGKYVMNNKVFPVPILTILADDLVRLLAVIPNANTVIAVQHVAASAPNAFEVHLTGTDHMSLTDLPLLSPLLVSLINASVPKGGGREVDPLATIEKMNALVLKFFDVYLKGEGRFTAAGTD
jgi:dienelactone hydrolase